MRRLIEGLSLSGSPDDQNSGNAAVRLRLRKPPLADRGICPVHSPCNTEGGCRPLGRRFGAPALWILPIVFPLVMAFGATGLLHGAGILLGSLMSSDTGRYVVRASGALIALVGAAAALSLPVFWMRALAVVLGAVPVVAMLFDHHLADVPAGFMVGVVFGLNLVFAAASSLVMITLERLPYGWVRIAWRAIAAWTVAVTMMLLALEISALQGEPEDLPGTTEQE